MSDISQIDGQSVRLKRETMGWAMADMATLACLSVKQIKQIEEGGTSAFYSESVKLTAARKVAALLNMTDAQLFGQHASATASETNAFAPDMAPPPENASLAQSSFAVPQPSNAASSEPSHASLSRSEALHVLAQPPEHIEADPAPATQETAETAPEAVLQQEVNTQAAERDNAVADTTTSGAPSSGGYMLKIFALFLVALAVAAFLRPKAGEEKSEQDAATPPPPLQVVPGANENAANPSEAQPVASGTAANLPAGTEKAADKPTTDKTIDKPADKPAEAPAGSASNSVPNKAAAGTNDKPSTTPTADKPAAEKPSASPATTGSSANK